MDYRTCEADDSEHLCRDICTTEHVVCEKRGSFLGNGGKQSPVVVSKATADGDKKQGHDLDPVFDDLDHGWAWVVMLACFASFFLQGGAMYAVGIIHSALLDRYEGSVTLTSWAGGLFASLCSLAGKTKVT